MNNLIWINSILPWMSLILVVFALAWIAASTRYDYFGDANPEKLKAFKKVNISVFICIALILIIFTAYFQLISKETFLILFIGGLSSLGFHLGIGYKEK